MGGRYRSPPPLAEGHAPCPACGRVRLVESIAPHTFAAVVVLRDCECHRSGCTNEMETERRVITMRVCRECKVASERRPLVLARHEVGEGHQGAVLLSRRTNVLAVAE